MQISLAICCVVPFVSLPKSNCAALNDWSGKLCVLSDVPAGGKRRTYGLIVRIVSQGAIKLVYIAVVV